MNPELPNAKDAKDPRNAQKGIHDFRDDYSHAVIGAAVEVQRVLGVGLLESAYSAALSIEMKARGLAFEREVPISATYKGQTLGVGYRADFIVEKSVILELKAIDDVMEAHRAQLLSYLRLTGLKLGLLINFNAFPVAKAIQRVVNNL